MQKVKRSVTIPCVLYTSIMKIQKLECKLVNEAAMLLGTRSPSGAEGDNYTEEVLLGFCSLQQTYSSAPDLTHYTTAFKVWIQYCC